MKWLKARIKKIRIIRLIYNFLKPYFRERFAIIQGHKMFINRKDYRICSHLLENKAWEEKETELVRGQIKEGDTVLDIGAHIGYYTLIFAELVGETGKVYAFEPDPNNFKLLKKNIRVNNYSNVVLINKGVSDKTGNVKFYPRSDGNTGGGRINPIDINIHKKPIEIDVVSLDDYFSGTVNFIKMDIEGSETMALRGMKNILKGNVKILIEGNMDSEYIKELYDFKIYKINNDNLFCVKE